MTGKIPEIGLGDYMRIKLRRSPGRARVQGRRTFKHYMNEYPFVWQMLKIYMLGGNTKDAYDQIEQPGLSYFTTQELWQDFCIPDIRRLVEKAVQIKLQEEREQESARFAKQLEDARELGRSEGADRSGTIISDALVEVEGALSLARTKMAAAKKSGNMDTASKAMDLINKALLAKSKLTRQSDQKGSKRTVAEKEEAVNTFEPTEEELREIRQAVKDA